MLLNRCEISEKKAVDCLIHGITDPSLRNSAQALKCQEPEDLLQYFVMNQPQIRPISMTQKKRGYYEGMEEGVPRSRVRCFTYGIEGHTSNRCFKIKREKGPAAAATSLKCFNCNEEGHRYTRCPKSILKCNRCKRMGHDEQNCDRSLSSNSKNFVKPEKVLNID